jgi:hypothetical protein
MKCLVFGETVSNCGVETERSYIATWHFTRYRKCPTILGESDDAFILTHRAPLGRRDSILMLFELLSDQGLVGRHGLVFGRENLVRQVVHDCDEWRHTTNIEAARSMWRLPTFSCAV